MPENQIISKNQKKGLLYGSLISAGIGAASGSNPQEALLNAARAGMSAYGGGLKSIYDQKAKVLDMERTRDLIEASKMSRGLQQQRFGLEQQRFESEEQRNLMGDIYRQKEHEFRQAQEDRLRRKQNQDFADRIGLKMLYPTSDIRQYLSPSAAATYSLGLTKKKSGTTKKDTARLSVDQANKIMDSLRKNQSKDVTRQIWDKVKAEMIPEITTTPRGQLTKKWYNEKVNKYISKHGLHTTPEKPSTSFLGSIVEKAKKFITDKPTEQEIYDKGTKYPDGKHIEYNGIVYRINQ